MNIEKVYSFFLITCVIVSLSLLLTSLYLGQSSQLIVSDGKAYYAWIRSIFIDNDIQFRNDYRLLYPPDPLPVEMEQLTPKGYVVNKYPIGLGFLEIPGFILGHVGAKFLQSMPQDGISLPYQISITFSLVCFYLWSAFLLFKGMIYLGCNKFWACLTCIMMILGTNMMHYIAKEPAMAHVAGCALFNIVVYVISQWPEKWENISIKQKLFIGGLLGLLVLVRNSNIALFPFLGMVLLHKRPCLLKPLLLIGTSMGAVICTQFVTLYLLWGRFQLITYPHESFYSELSGIIKTLVSHRHGLFIYHPWYLLLLIINIIAVLFGRTRNKFSFFSLMSFCIFLAINGMWWCWWFGNSFGNRAFIEVLPILSIGSCTFLSNIRLSKQHLQIVYSMCLCICVLNAYLWVGYLLQKYPHDGGYTMIQTYLWPLMF